MQANFAALDDRMSNRLRCDYVTLTFFSPIYSGHVPAVQRGDLYSQRCGFITASRGRRKTGRTFLPLN